MDEPDRSDFDHIEITRKRASPPKEPAPASTVVYSGKGTTYTDRGLQNGVEYRYVIASVDKNGNKGAGVPAVVVPKKGFQTPGRRREAQEIPKQFVWVADPKATYYNLQLFPAARSLQEHRGEESKKILSTWTTGPLFVFKSPWKWEGRSYKMTKGSTPGTSGRDTAARRRQVRHVAGDGHLPGHRRQSRNRSETQAKEEALTLGK